MDKSKSAYKHLKSIIPIVDVKLAQTDKSSTKVMLNVAPTPIKSSVLGYEPGHEIQDWVVAEAVLEKVK